MVERVAVNDDVPGSSPGSPAITDLLSLDEAAKFIPGVDKETLKRKARAGKLRVYRIGKELSTTLADLQGMIQACLVVPKGPRLWWREPLHNDTGKLTTHGTWLIIDGIAPAQHWMRLGDVAGAEQALTNYLTEKHTENVSVGARDPSVILIDDILARYVRDVVAKHARPGETGKRIGQLRKFWGGSFLAEVTGEKCRSYVRQRSTANAARRELEDFRAAINHHRREGLHDKIVSVVLPEKSEPRERWLTRNEAAHLILSAWRYREMQNYRGTDRRTRRHVARFMVVARYMGSRASVICGASIESKRPTGKPWVDLSNGVFYGRPVGQRESQEAAADSSGATPLLAHLRRWRASGQRYAVEWNGEPIANIKKGHNAAVAYAGFGSDVTPHTWRHSLATWLMQAGTDPWKAAGFLGMSVDTLLRTYGHHHPDHSGEVHTAMGAHRKSTVKDKSEQKGTSTNAGV